jgi:hypothetical protein
MAASFTDESVEALATAVFQPGEVTVVEAYSAFGAELISFRSPEELAGYVRAQHNAPDQSAHMAIYYRDMGGEILRSRLTLDPEKCHGHTYRYGAAGWGLIWVRLEWRQSPAGSFISANSEKRAIAWAPTHPELGAPEQWNWTAVRRHLRRLRRVIKLAA